MSRLQVLKLVKTLATCSRACEGGIFEVFYALIIIDRPIETSLSRALEYLWLRVTKHCSRSMNVLFPNSGIVCASQLCIVPQRLPRTPKLRRAFQSPAQTSKTWSSILQLVKSSLLQLASLQLLKNVAQICQVQT